MKKLDYLMMPFVMAFALILIILIPTKTSAAVITARGLSSGDAAVIKQNGTNTTNNHDLDQYTVSYKWSIPDNTKIKNNDTLKFELPTNVQIKDSMKFDITNQNNKKVGEATISKGATEGIITITNAENLEKSRSGKLSFTAYKKVAYSAKTWIINKADWITSNNKKQIMWQLIYNPDAKKLKNVTITNTLGSNAKDKKSHQKYVANSLKVETGTIDSHDNFKTADAVKADVNVNGDQLKINLGQISTPILITYLTEPDSDFSGSLINKVADSDNHCVDAQVVKDDITTDKNDSASTNVASESNEQNNHQAADTSNSATSSHVTPITHTSTNNSHRLHNQQEDKITTTTIPNTRADTEERGDVIERTFNQMLPQTGAEKEKILTWIGIALIALVGMFINIQINYRKN